MPRINYVQRWSDNRINLESIPEANIGSIVKECYRMLSFGRFTATMKNNDKSDTMVRREILHANDDQRLAEIDLATNTLVKLGYKFTDYQLDENWVVWLRIRKIDHVIEHLSHRTVETLERIDWQKPMLVKDHIKATDIADNMIRRLHGSVGLINVSECLTFNTAHVMRYWHTIPSIANVGMPFVSCQYYANDNVYMGYTTNPFLEKWICELDRRSWPTWVEGFHGLRHMPQYAALAKMHQHNPFANHNPFDK